MQTEEDTWRQAIQDEEDASAAVVEAEKALHRQLQHHRAGSPTVDDAVSELDLRRTEYAVAMRATDQAATVYQRAQGEIIAAERDRRRADHQERVQAVLQQARVGPTKRLNLGPPSSGPAIQTTGSEEVPGRSGDSEGSSSGNASERADTGRSGGSEGSSSGNASERADMGRSGDSEGSSGDSEGSSSGNASEPPPLPLNRLMPMALLSPQVSGVPPSMPAPTPAEAQTPDDLVDSESESKSQPAESDGNDENAESDSKDENAESDGNDASAESDRNDENAESDSKDENAESDGNDASAESDRNDEIAESDGNDENAESVESSEFVPSSEAEDSETES
ncbi:hypothetical protein PF002_g21758 [Phytophthora fragariae]|uniref:Uncharacterized protein n=1 Tax=Phytophthora fragariae TaxID=53985 RepID=A0A6A3TF12_9STRA|nr:hypothetical protein PF003_g23150 [Phytophthora fragariae]KAE9135118.1 hypothetical protein PF006_g14682 [Phytophthora fragariae]KAE9195982.1 hypothetical protein PF004_g20282 [Phytophthora fragariae]KAE9200667.1 hypothetical protein PF002_g21758 [Phytophthora fragariae]